MNLAAIICVKKETLSERFKRKYLSIFVGSSEEPNQNRTVFMMPRGHGKSVFTEQMINAYADREIHLPGDQSL